MNPVYGIFRKTLFGWDMQELPNGYYDSNNIPRGLRSSLPEIMIRHPNFTLPVNLNNIPHL